MSAVLRLRREALEWREVDGEFLVLSLDDSVYFNVNRSGAAIWKALIAGTSREELISRLSERFGLDERAVGRDVDAFLADLQSRGMLEPDPADS